MALTFSSSQAASREVETVSFGFFTSDEARRISVKAITRPDFHDARGFPVPDGLCDPALGTLNDTDSCKTCGLLSFTCPGHCGHIDLALTVYNPLLFRSLCKLLHITCISCNRFRMKSDKAHFYVSKLNLIMKGDVAGARKLKLPSSFFKSKKGDMDGSEPVDDVPAFVDEEEACTMEDGSVSEVLASPMGPKRTNWTSLQQTEAYSVLTEIMHEIRKECENCCFKNPKIWSPVHGIIEMEMRDSDIRANVIGRLNRENVSSDSGIDSLIGVDVSKSDGSPSEIQTGLASDQWTNLPADFIKQKKLTSIQLLPYKVKLLLRNLWRKEGKLCELICDIQQKTLHVSTGKDYNIFFMDVIIVPPCKFRPTAKGNDRDRLLQHPQNILLAQVLESNISLRDAKMNNAESSVVFRRWKDLQRRVNVLFDSSKGFAKDKEAIGLRQLLEKKAGILRQKMMGKRVNFACRSVISPDPFLAVNEIGIPPHFAMTLTYPERVTPWNANRLRHAVICGTDVHPGATHFKDKERVYRLNIPRNVRLSISRKLSTSRTSHMHSRKGPDSDFEGKVVHRHLRNGDVVLVNRQPTLHKLSIKGHVVRVLEGEKTLRFHYTNCNSYNADFDGDEMNVHLPQDEISRAEAINIVNANKQYTLPTSGKPDRGLIQDHIVSAVLLTKIDTFLNREEYNQLLYASCIPPICSDLFTSRKKVNLLSCDWEIEPVPPAILKPVPLWTGKQVISAILNYVTRDQLPCNVRKTAKTSADYLGGNSGTFKSKEHKVRILNNEIIHGIIDKEQFGSFGLVHTVNELYGSDAAGALLSSFSRLFTVFLQMHGFTCGIDDLLTVPESEAQRRKELNKSKERSREAHCSFLRIDSSNDLDQRELQLQVEKVTRENGESATAILDRKMVNAMGVLTKTIANQLIPNGLKKPFARNCVTLMTTTGAKGKMDNFIQISALLGQQQLEGKRVPSMVSGKTLPCFPPYDTAPRAGGFIGDRFLTGLRLQEYYFHCMAGREGLVDTAVKTSRSGYLQRCLVKNLEALRVCYDHTVRDADGSIIQFLYGEDGIDAHQTGFLHQFKSIDINKEVIFDRLSSQGMQGCFSVSNSFFKGLPEKIKDGVENYITKMSKERKRKKHFPHRCKKENFLKLMELKYLSSLCPPGEAVGVLAAQSVGEPSTQMTLNTFHHAGRGEMNVTLGIPRLQEIYMNAKQNIKTPIMTCPLHVGLTEKDAIVLSEKLGRVSVADIIESLEVRVVPLVVSDKEASTIYKLKIKIYSPELFPQIGLTLENCMAILADNFVVAVSAAIEKHLAALLRFKDIQVGSQVVHDTSMDENGEDESGSDPVKETGKHDDDGGGSDIDEDDDGDDEDLGADAEKRKLQSRDEMEYDDNENEKQKTTILSSQALEVEESEIESEIDQSESDQDQAMEEEDEGSAQVDVEKQEKHSELEDGSRTIVGEHVSTDGKNSVLKKKKKNERAIYVKAEGRELEVHFKSKGEPHLLLAEIAQKTAKNVFLKQVKNIERCTVLPDKEGEKVWMLQTAGVDFSVFWDQEDYLDINKISSNDIHAVLNTYGVEAARATIVNEVNSLFKHYEVSLDTRHLNLIADFITVGGDYRPMNRNGVTKYSTSPFGKITFETATKFIIEAAFHGESDTLEGPSSSICLGQPVKLGTGMFDVMHNF